MRTPTSSLLRLVAMLLALALVAAACGDSDDSDASSGEGTTTTAADDGGETTEAMSDEDPSDEGTGDGAMADESMDPVKIGLIAQVEELSSFPEVPAAAEAMRDFFNTEQGGIDGHPIELVTCTAGDTPESAVACAQEFANDDSVHVVLQGHLNTTATNDTLVAAGKPVLNLGNDVPDYLVPGVYTFDPGVLGLANVIFVYAAGSLGTTTATVFYADDPLFEGFLPLLDALAAAEGITITENIPLGFEPDLTGPVSAADPANEAWIFVLADGAQCTAAAGAVDTVGYEGSVIANDLCMSKEVVESGAVDGWAGPVVSLAPTNDPDPDVAEINRILDTYGGANAQTAGLAGWTMANMEIARDALTAAGGAEATDAAVSEALATYARADVLGYPEVSCPGPGSFVGACNRSPLVVVVDGGEMTAPEGFVEIDYSQFEILLEG